MRIKKNFVMQDFIDMYNLEKRFYSEERITPPDETFQWYQRYPNFSTVVEDKGKIIGFFDLFPIKDTMFQQLKEGVFNDSELGVDSIEDIQTMKAGEKVNMYLCCVVVDENYRKTDALKIMMKAQIEYYKQFTDRGIEIEFIITDNVTSSGENFSRRMGFTKLTDTIFHSVIYMQKYSDFLGNV